MKSFEGPKPYYAGSKASCSGFGQAGSGIWAGWQRPKRHTKPLPDPIAKHLLNEVSILEVIQPGYGARPAIFWGSLLQRIKNAKLTLRRTCFWSKEAARTRWNSLMRGLAILPKFEPAATNYIHQEAQWVSSEQRAIRCKALKCHSFGHST